MLMRTKERGNYKPFIVVLTKPVALNRLSASRNRPAKYSSCSLLNSFFEAESCSSFLGHVFVSVCSPNREFCIGMLRLKFQAKSGRFA